MSNRTKIWIRHAERLCPVGTLLRKWLANLLYASEHADCTLIISAPSRSPFPRVPPPLLVGDKRDKIGLNDHNPNHRFPPPPPVPLNAPESPTFGREMRIYTAATTVLQEIERQASESWTLERAVAASDLMDVSIRAHESERETNGRL